MIDILKEFGNRSLLEEAIARMIDELKFSKEDCSMLIIEFIESLKAYLEELEQELTSLDWNSLSRSAHTLKGLASNMRIKPLYESLNQLEMASKNSKEELCREKMKEIVVIYKLLLKDMAK